MVGLIKNDRNEIFIIKNRVHTVKRSISAQNLKAYSNQHDELILNICMAKSNFALTGGKTHFSMKKELKISKITFFQSIIKKLLNGTIIFEKLPIKNRECQRYRAEKSNNFGRKLSGFSKLTTFLICELFSGKI